MSNAFTNDDLLAEYQQLEHEWFVERNFDRPPTTEFMERAMRLLKGAVDRLDDLPDQEDLRASLLRDMNEAVDARAKELKEQLEKSIVEVVSWDSKQ